MLRRCSSLWMWLQSGGGRLGDVLVCAGKRRRSSSASSIPSGIGQPMPATRARARQSATVERARPTAFAIWRSLTPLACSSLRISRIFRIGALSAGIGFPRVGCRVPIQRFGRRQREPSAHFRGGRLRSEQVADIRRNRWPECVGTSGRHGPEFATSRELATWLPGVGEKNLLIEPSMSVEPTNNGNAFEGPQSDLGGFRSRSASALRLFQVYFLILPSSKKPCPRRDRGRCQSTYEFAVIIFRAFADRTPVKLG